MKAVDQLRSVGIQSWGEAAEMAINWKREGTGDQHAGNLDQTHFV